MSITNFHDISGWPAELVTIEDNSISYYKKRGIVDSVCGKLTLLPAWKHRYVYFDNKDNTFGLDVYFESSNIMLRAEELYKLGPKSRLVVEGRLFKQIKKDTGTTGCFSLEDWVTDYHEGKANPSSAVLTSADKEEFIAVADLRYAAYCTFCSNETEEVAAEGIRFCNTCQI
jgi:hypothetical protein